jgi:Protein of unknown function (DUF1573)
MYKILLPVCLLLILPVLSYAAPVIHFDEVGHDFGSIGQHDSIEYVFEFSNAGDQPLVIEKLTAS